MIRTILAAVLLAAPASAQLLGNDFETVESPHSVAETMDRLVAAVEGAGATVFARVDHAQGALSADMDLRDAQLLVFGNPKLGTPVMQADIRAGLYLPLRVLVHASDEGTVLVYEEPAEMLDDLDLDDDMPAIEQMEGALQNLTRKAASTD
ncbi:DUF302 domain-containing protein [Jannaschia sp. S6380]|uniref:DUF302 domain-containing protein n=1 Tax=Jannaschia sp. S6380 TaxID=2926408 RepID=UPI001FF4AFD2|nr:DUF302 domain-containing protein [Jannaschia sp. S6380]MCK0167396.1 DUF302 domain-containing protein [Jannaschia sp. S6380]